MPFANTLRLMFPPLNKVTVFVIAVTLCTAFIYIEWLPSPIDLIAMFLRDVGSVAGQSFINFFMMLLFGFLVVLAMLVLLVGPLMLPFTQADLRWTAWLVVGIFVVISSVYGIFLFLSEPHKLLNQLLLVYTILWLGYLIFVVRFIEEPGFVIDDQQVDPLTPIIAAAVAVTFVHVANVYYSVSWHVAFFVGVTSASSIVPLLIKAGAALLRKTQQKEE